MTGGANICAAVEFLIWIRILFVVLHTVTLLESVYTSAGINELLLAGEKRMAFGANFNANILFRGAGSDYIATCTSDSGFFILRMDIFLHSCSPLSLKP